MTAGDDRPVASIADLYENLHVPEGFKAELLRGEIVMTAGPDWVRNMIVLQVQKQIPRLERWYPLQTQDLAIPGGSKFGDPLPVEALDLTLDTSRFRTLPGSPR
ncbi:hypothetical protein [Streptomyces sp. NPDC006274]|uniref:hypothetical protein n=1 Tax=unclassified Streptomyces TaxID=2593676 RepID=UPI0033A3B47E